MNKIVKILRNLDHPILSLAVRNTAIVLIVVILSFLTLNYFTQRPRAEAPVSVMPTKVAVLSPLASISFGYSPVPLYIPLVPAPTLELPSPVAEATIETTTYTPAEEFTPTEEATPSTDPTTTTMAPTAEPPLAVIPADVPEDTSPPETVAPTRTPRPRTTTPQPSPTPTPTPAPVEEEPTALPTLEVIWQDLTDWISDTFTIDLRSDNQQNKVQDTDKGDKEDNKVKASDQDDEKGKAHGKDSNRVKDQDKDSGKGKKGQDKD